MLYPSVLSPEWQLLSVQVKTTTTLKTQKAEKLKNSSLVRKIIKILRERSYVIVQCYTGWSCNVETHWHFTGVKIQHSFYQTKISLGLRCW